jgi:very-short-patch-repair endonuclease
MRRKRRVEDKTLAQARQLRRDLTPAEKTLWWKLRDRQLLGLKFARQFPVGPFVADFCCPAAKVIIEIDGDSHAESVAKDAARTEFLEREGYRVIRFYNSDVHRNLMGVLECIAQACGGLAFDPSP